MLKQQQQQMNIGTPKTKQTTSHYFQLANKMNISSKNKTQMKGLLEALALLMSHQLDLNLVSDSNCANESPSPMSNHSLSDIDDDLIMHAHCTEATTIVVDLSDGEIDDWK